MKKRPKILVGVGEMSILIRDQEGVLHDLLVSNQEAELVADAVFAAIDWIKTKKDRDTLPHSEQDPRRGCGLAR